MCASASRVRTEALSPCWTESAYACAVISTKAWPARISRPKRAKPVRQEHRSTGEFLGLLRLRLFDFDNLSQAQRLLFSRWVTGRAGPAGPPAARKDAPGREAATQMGSSEANAMGTAAVKNTVKAAVKGCV